MKIVFKKSDLTNAVNIVSKAIVTRTTMSILECIFIEAGDKIKFIANDMELGIETIVKGEILERGQIAIDAKMLSDIVRKLPDEDITIETDENFVVNITCGKINFKINGKEGYDFIFLPKFEREESIYFSQFTLKEIIKQTIFSILNKEDGSIAKTMSGELFEIKGNILKVVSLDGHRISIRKVELKESFKDISVIVPGKSLNEINKILNGGNEDMVRVFFTKNVNSDSNVYSHIVFEFDNTVVVSRLIEGNYFNIDKMISSDYDVKFKVNKKELYDCIDRATLFSSDKDNQPIVTSITDDNVEITINSSMGYMDENVRIEKTGKDLVIGFNPKFIMDALKVIDDEEVSFYMLNAKSPCFIKNDEESYIYIILPVNL